MKKILILGSSGMLGHCLLNLMSKRNDIEVKGTIRDKSTLNKKFLYRHSNRLYNRVEAYDISSLFYPVEDFKPDIIINAIGIIKQLKSSNNALSCININSLLPHMLCSLFSDQCRIIHISTDCVFDGLKGNYTEEDNPSPVDLYGRSKLLGEVYDNESCITLRTSIIGHELFTHRGLLEWFLNQKGKTVNGFTKAIFTGFTVLELERIIHDYIIDSKLSGLYQISSEKISKFSLLNFIKDTYKLNIEVIMETNFEMDRSLNSDKFKRATGYKPPIWEKMIEDNYNYYLSNKYLYED